MQAQEFNLEVIPILPKALERLEDLANDLWYSWNVPTRMLFERLDDEYRHFSVPISKYFPLMMLIVIAKSAAMGVSNYLNMP